MLEAPNAPSGASPGSVKRRLETEERNSRKKKKVELAAEVTGKSQKRGWTDEDEITILKGLVDLRRRGKDSSHVSELYNSIKPFFSNPNHNINQLDGKIRYIKQKYDTTLKKVAINGVDPKFSKPHDAEVYMLSKQVWAPAGSKDNELTAVERRVWSDEDEIILLEEMVNLKKRGRGLSHLAELFNSIKHLLGPNITKKLQVESKIKLLKHKYDKNLKNVGLSGEDPSFARPHDAKVYQLSKQIWGPAEIKDNKREPVHIQLVAEESGSEERDLPIPPLGKAGCNLMAASNAARLDKQWKNVVIAEIKAYLERIDLVREQTQAMLDMLKSTDIRVIV